MKANAQQPTSHMKSIRETLAMLMENDEVSQYIRKPSFQRASTRWNDAKKSRLIDTIVKKGALPMFYVWEHNDESKIVDGLQRSTAMMEFKANKFAYIALSDHEESFLRNIKDPYAPECYYGFDDPEKEKEFIEVLKVKYKNHQRGFRVFTEKEKRQFNMYELTITTDRSSTEEQCREIFVRINIGGQTLSNTEILLALYNNDYINTLRTIYSGMCDSVREEDLIKFWHSIGYKLNINKGIKEQAQSTIKLIMSKIDSFVEQHIVALKLFELTETHNEIIKDVKNIGMRNIKDNAFRSTKNKTEKEAIEDFFLLKTINEKISEYKQPGQYNKDMSQISVFKVIKKNSKAPVKNNTIYMYALQSIFNNILASTQKRQEMFNSEFSTKFSNFYNEVVNYNSVGKEIDNVVYKLANKSIDSAINVENSFKFIKLLFNNEILTTDSTPHLAK